MPEPKESYETINGCKTYVQRGGKGPTLLFLHGGGGAGVWLPIFQTLAQKYDVIVPEHPGFGRSDTPEWLDTIGDLSFFYLDFIDTLGLKDVHLVGLSLGGWIAAELATRNTAKIKTLTLMAAAGINLPDVPKGDPFLWSPEQAVRNMFYDQALAERRLASPPSEDDVNRQLKNSLMLAKLSWQPRLFNPHLHKWLHRIDRPALVMWGDSDKIFPPAYGKAYAEMIPGARLEVLAQCGHALQAEKADAVAKLIAEFAK